MTKVYCSEAAVGTIYDCMRVVGIASYTKEFAPLERIMRDAMVFPLYDGGNQGVRRRQLHEMFRQPGTTRCWPPVATYHPGSSDTDAITRRLAGAPGFSSASPGWSLNRERCSSAVDARLDAAFFDARPRPPRRRQLAHGCPPEEPP